MSVSPAPDRTRRSMPVVRAPRLREALPASVQSHVSGGRDRWSAPSATLPGDPEAALRRALGEVLDPELPISLIDLGLIYGIEWRDGDVRIDLTFTATACPCMEFIREDIRDRLESEPWVESVRIDEVWDPPWTAERITDRGRALLKNLGVGVG